MRTAARPTLVLVVVVLGLVVSCNPATGKVVAGSINPDDTFADMRVLLRSGASRQRSPIGIP